ncbi:MAG: sulfite exporter TauE/SafE family protein [Chloroflexi bacterium]|nr:sulfite exporter TauE/SafE family protein [Chloroflexota bacterium]MCL5075070.1 sulfite exporter TauE/SafE family protein [Chloroflexota bacterium]
MGQLLAQQLPLLAFGGILFAALTQGSTGFGFALVSAPILLLFFEPRSTVMLVLLLGSLLDVFIIWQGRHYLDISRIVPLSIASVVGTPLGAYLLVVMSAPLLKILIGTSVVLSSLPLIFGYTRTVKNETLASAVVGFISGAMNSSTAMSGPPVALYFTNQRYDKEKFRTTLVAFFLLSNLVAIGMLSPLGALNGHVLQNAMLFTPAVVVGFLASVKLSKYIQGGLFQGLVFALVIGTGMVGILSGLKVILGG